MLRSNFLEFNSPENHYFYPVQAKTTDSGLTNYDVNIPMSRKRDLPNIAKEDNNSMQFEMDSIISRHTQKMRLELEDRRKREARSLVSALGERVTTKLREKDEQIQRMGKANVALQDRVKSACEENQLWRDLARSNEAAVNSLRANLELLLSREHAEEDVESTSCFGETNCCRVCGDRESRVLLLPCRHLCLCGVCGTGSRQLQACPVCNTSVNATLHVNMS